MMDSHPTSGSAAPRRLDAGVCLFSVGAERFALDTALVGEVIQVPSLLSLPASPRAVVGLFSLRGSPLVVVDLLAVLGRPVSEAPTGPTQVLVLQDDQGLLAALRINRLEAVLPSGTGRRVLAETPHSHPAVVGVFEVEGQPARALLGPEALVKSLLQVGFEQAPQA